jgi:redox-sensitive bicupin YhaK (pirin superfamily)
MKIQDLKLTTIPPHALVTVSSASDARVVAADLEPGESLPDSGADGPMWLMPIAGEVELLDESGGRALAGPASLVELEAGERPEARARTRARVLLFARAQSAAPAAERRPDEAAGYAV